MINKFTLSKFLEDFSLLIGNEEEETENEKDKVKLMTIHQAKGLEFKYVFIVGLEEEYYPCGAYIKDLEELEEERRIFYVAITRAKINCYLSYANERLINNELKKRNQSPFLSDIYNSKYIQKYDLDNNLNFKNYVDKGGSGSLNYFNNKEKGNNNNEIIYDIYNFKKSKKKRYKKHNYEIKYNFKQKINFTKNILSKDINNFIKNFNEIESLNNNIIDIDENENENLNNNNINNKNDKINKIEKKEETKNQKSKNKFINKKTLRFKTIDSFFSPK